MISVAGVGSPVRFCGPVDHPEKFLNAPQMGDMRRPVILLGSDASWCKNHKNRMHLKGNSVNTEQLIARVRNILLTPKTEWPVIAAEPDSTAGLYTRYIMILSALPAIAGFLKSSLIGYGSGFGGTFRVGFGVGLSSAILQYALGLGAVYVVALIINALAPTFGAQKSFIQALKATAYAFTASWIGGALVILPWFGFLFSLAGVVYAIYLLYLGLPVTMDGPREKAAGYTAVSMICAIIVFVVVGALVGRITGVGAMIGSSMSSSNGSTLQFSSGSSGTTTVETGSAMAQLGAMAQNMQASSQKLQAAQQSGDVQAQQKAAGQMLSGLFSGGQTVEALSPEQLKPFVPDTLDGLARKTYSVQRSAVMGLQVAQAQASYKDDAGVRSVDLEIVDMGGAKGLAALAGWAVQSSESQTDTGYDKVYQDGSRMVHEEWNNQTHAGTFSIVIANRFSVELRGNGMSMQDLKGLAASLDLSGLEALKQSGVKAG
jgi:hypothetical protein